MTKSLHRQHKVKGMNTQRARSSGGYGKLADVIWRSRAFQVRAVTTAKARSPTVDSRVRPTGSDDVDTDCRRDLIPMSAGWKSLSTRHISAVPLQHLKARTASCNESVLELLANEGAERCSLTWIIKTRTTGQRSL